MKFHITYVKDNDLSCPYHNFPFHEMPLMSIYSIIFHSIHSERTDVILGIKQLLDDEIIIHWMIDAVFNAKLMFRNVFDLEGNYAGLVALIRTQLLSQTFRIYCRAIFSTVIKAFRPRL